MSEITGTQQLEIVKDAILKVMRSDEKVLLKSRESKQKRGIRSDTFDKDINILCARLHGQMDICDSLGIDRSEFNWIFNI